MGRRNGLEGASAKNPGGDAGSRGCLAVAGADRRAISYRMIWKCLSKPLCLYSAALFVLRQAVGTWSTATRRFRWNRSCRASRGSARLRKLSRARGQRVPTTP